MFGHVDAEMWDREEWRSHAQAVHQKFRQFCKPLTKDSNLDVPTKNFCHRMFKEFDLDADNYITGGEFCMLLHSLGIEEYRREQSDEMDIPFELYAMQAFDAFDYNVDGKINKLEFERLFGMLMKQYPDLIPDDEFEASRRAEAERIEKARELVQDTSKEFEMLKLDEAAMMRIFELFDRDGSGGLDMSEIAMIVKEMGIADYERDSYRGFIERNKTLADDDDDGTIEFDEFSRLIQSVVTCKINRNYRKQVLEMKKPVQSKRPVRRVESEGESKSPQGLWRSTTSFVNKMGGSKSSGFSDSRVKDLVATMKAHEKELSS